MSVTMARTRTVALSLQRVTGEVVVFEHINPDMWHEPEMRSALAARDISTVYRLLNETGVTQRQISQLTGQSQSEVSEIIKGTRRVLAYDLLERICDGLGIPRGLMGLAYSPGCEPAPMVGEEVTEEMKRRALLAAGAVALSGRPILGEVLHLPAPPPTPTPLPSELGMADVTAIRALTAKLQAVGQEYGGYAGVLTPITSRAEQLMTVPAAAGTRRAMASALSEIHSVAGWAAFDAHVDDLSRYHFARAMTLGREGSDRYRLSYAMYLAGVVNEERGYPDDALKLFQMGQIGLQGVEQTDQTASLQAWLHADSAGALVNLHRDDLAKSELRRAREAAQPADSADAAELEFVCALVEKGLGRLDVAEQHAASAVRHRNGTPDRRAALVERIALADIHLAAGEPSGFSMAERIIRDVEAHRSLRARERLQPLAAALETWGGGAHDLARWARQVAGAPTAT
ncbi:MAG: helix-turn-helix domain-containing protein [Pseudonocardiaceae bacterium]